LEQLVPALQQRGLRVEVQSGWVDDLVDLFNSATVVLYDSAPYWRGRGVSEGFGLPPIEALACGCVVFSSFNHALADNLDPGLVGHQLGAGTLAGDLERITAAVGEPGAWRAAPEALDPLLRACSEQALLTRWREALVVIDQHWDRLAAGAEPLQPPPVRWLWWLRLRQALVNRISGPVWVLRNRLSAAKR
jgi:glycosyltransferase involved in cell wall biosynthesis